MGSVGAGMNINCIVYKCLIRILKQKYKTSTT